MTRMAGLMCVMALVCAGCTDSETGEAVGVDATGTADGQSGGVADAVGAEDAGAHDAGAHDAGADDIAPELGVSNDTADATELPTTPMECAEAVITSPDPQVVDVGTSIRLSGASSSGANGTVSLWEWSAVTPTGVHSAFIPNMTHENPTFEAWVVGEYEFRLVVTDSNGVQSCVSEPWIVTVQPPKALYVELLWSTPQDSDESDVGPKAGSDIDLHFADVTGQGGPDHDQDGVSDPWFHPLYDCYWFSQSPNWGDFMEGVDDPFLLRDDTDGAGPEAVVVSEPAASSYRVGVHYRSDYDYGDSTASVRVFIDQNLVYETSDVPMTQGDLWDVLTIEWPSGQLTESGENGLPKITPNYPTTM